MKTTYNYATHKNEVWYSEEEYEALKTKYEIAMKKLAEITEDKLEKRYYDRQ